MGKVFKLYFGHWTIWAYVFLAMKLMAFLWLTKAYTNFAISSLIVILLAPFAEWILHKYVLHASYDPDNKAVAEYMERLHVGHHREPQKVDYYFAPLSAGLTLPIGFFFMILILTQDSPASFFFGNSLLSLYEWIHLAHHVDEYKPKTPWGKRLKKAHKWHHFKRKFLVGNYLCIRG